MKISIVRFGNPVLWDARNPPFQAPFDPEKKTIVILGSGWASTSLLKSIDTDLYNVVCAVIFLYLVVAESRARSFNSPLL